MIKEVKVDGMEEFSTALIKMKKGTAPAITSDDDGKILTASYDAETGGSTSWEDAPNGVPAVTSGDGGKILTASYNAETGGSASWQDPPESVPVVTSGDAGKVLTAHYTEGVGASMSWDTPETPASLVYDNTLTTQIGEYREHSGDTVTVYPIKSGVYSPSSTIYLSNGSGAFDASIGDNAEILSCNLIAKDGYNLYIIPCTVSHATGTSPANTTYSATWNGSGLPGNGGSAKFYVTYIERDIS